MQKYLNQSTLCAMDSNLRQRLITAVIMAILFLTLLLYNIITIQALFIIIMYCMLFEFLTISVSELTGAVAHLFWAFVGSSLALLYLVYKEPNDTYFQIMNTICIVYIFVNSIMLLGKRKTLLPKIPSFQAFFYISFPTYILLNWIRHTENYTGIILAIFLMIWISDIAAYFVGKTFGKRKLFPAISPNKTWAGFLGAGVFTLTAGWLGSSSFYSYIKLDQLD